jgi:hypothetical protein
MRSRCSDSCSSLSRRLRLVTAKRRAKTQPLKRGLWPRRLAPFSSKTLTGDADGTKVMKHSSPKEVHVGIAWITEIYDGESIPDGFAIDGHEVTLYYPLEAQYVTACVAFEQAVLEQSTTEVKAETGGFVQECAPNLDSLTTPTEEKRWNLYASDLRAMLRTFFF